MRSEAARNGGTEATGLVLQDTYTLGERIGQGAMGAVYAATHARLPGRYAVKILRSHLLTNEDAFRRFCREAEIMSALRHPHIVQIFDFNTSREKAPQRVGLLADLVAQEAPRGRGLDRLRQRRGFAGGRRPTARRAPTSRRRT